MAKANQQTSTSPRWEAAGWGFWSIVFLILLGPSIYLSFQISYEQSSMLVLVIVGFSIAAFIAGIVTFIVNAILQTRAERFRRAAQGSTKKKR